MKFLLRSHHRNRYVCLFCTLCTLALAFTFHDVIPFLYLLEYKTLGDVGKADRILKSPTSTSTLPPYPWQWIHPGKTGSSFGNTLYMLGCPEDYGNWATSSASLSDLEEHSIISGKGLQAATKTCRQRWTNGPGYDIGSIRPIRSKWWLGDHAYRNTSLSDNQIFLTLREPVDRMISHLFMLENIAPKTDEEMAEIILQHISSPTMSYYMTSMLLEPGEINLLQDNDVSSSAVSAITKACQVVRNAAWVGFTHDFERSVCLLHERFDFPHHPAEEVNMRKSTKSLKSIINATAVGILVRERTDILDDQLYRCARERFLEELKQVPKCLL